MGWMGGKMTGRSYYFAETGKSKGTEINKRLEVETLGAKRMVWWGVKDKKGFGNYLPSLTFDYLHHSQSSMYYYYPWVLLLP